MTDALLPATPGETFELEQFLFHEADLLDERKFRQWLECFAEDICYQMPMVRNLRFAQIDKEYLTAPQDIYWIDEGFETLSQRVEQILTGIHWAEEPLSRTSHLITNVRAFKEATSTSGLGVRFKVNSRFLMYRNRLRDEEDFLIGKRDDVIIRHGDAWKISRRTIRLDQNVLLAKNLTTFL